MPVAHVNGIGLFYLEVGEGLPCLVMHGGLGVDHTYLHPWLDSLGDVLHLVYYDHRGNGCSGRPPPETLTFAKFAADAEALRQHLGLGSIAVIGHSFGGFIALEYALRHPRSVSHLILADTAPAFDYFDEVYANAERKSADEEVLAVLRAPSPAEDAELARMFRVIAPLYFRDFDAGVAERMLSRTVWRASAAVRSEQLLAEYNVTARLSEISVPTLILAGRDDFICPPSQAARLHAGIPQSSLVIFERSGHFPYLEEPDAFFAAIRSWLGRAHSSAHA